MREQARVDSHIDYNVIPLIHSYGNSVSRFNYSIYNASKFIDAMHKMSDLMQKNNNKQLDKKLRFLKNYMSDTYSIIDGSKFAEKPMMTDVARAITAYEFGSKLGLNIRGAARNATQSLFNWIFFGNKGIGEYREALGNADMRVRIEKGLKNNGILFPEIAEVYGSKLTKTEYDAKTGTYREVVDLSMSDNILSKMESIAETLGKPMSWVENRVNRRLTFGIAYAKAWNVDANNARLMRKLFQNRYTSKNGFENAKNIRSEGLTFGFDRKFGDNKFLGWALRYGDSKSNIHNSKQNTDLESLTFNLYGIIPTNENRYINVVLGLSALRYDNKYLGNLSGKRTGRQAFTSINYRTQNTYGKFNLTPTGKFTLGVTRLSDYTDFISTTINGSTTDVKYAEDTFGSGEVAAGFLFDMNKIEVNQGTLQPMGGIEILYDLTPNVDYKYKLQGATPVNRETIIGSYSKRSLKTNIGFELIYLNGFTISPSYEKFMSLSDNERIPGERKKTYSERLIIKLSSSKEEKGSKFAFDFDPLTNDFANLSYAKDIGNFNLKLNSNYSSINRISDYGANIELSGTF